MFRKDFGNRLNELTVNSRPIIQSLSMFAHDYVRFAEIVSQCLEAHIRRVSTLSVIFQSTHCRWGIIQILQLRSCVH